MPNQPLGKQTGFTLIEFLIVIAMVGIMSAVAVASIKPQKFFNAGNDARRKNDLKQLQNALASYYTDKGDYPPAANPGGWCTQISRPTEPAVKNELQPTYTKNVPLDPVYANSSKDYFYWKPSQGAYRLYAVLESVDDPDLKPGILSNDGGASCFGYDASYNYKVENP